jgi:hypothetical protein
MRRSTPRLVVVASCLLILLVSTACGSTSTTPSATTATIDGTVTNKQTGAFAPNLVVTCVDTVTNQSLSATTDAQGAYTIKNAIPGHTYECSVSNGTLNSGKQTIVPVSDKDSTIPVHFQQITCDPKSKTCHSEDKTGPTPPPGNHLPLSICVEFCHPHPSSARTESSAILPADKARVPAITCPPPTIVCYQGGPIMDGPFTAYIILWAPDNLCYEQPNTGACAAAGGPTTVDSTYQSLLQQFYGNVSSNAGYWKIMQQYTNAAGNGVGNVTLGGFIRVTDPYPAGVGVNASGLTDAEIQLKVCQLQRALNINPLNPEQKGNFNTQHIEFFVYTPQNIRFNDSGLGLCSPDVPGCPLATQGICAFHNYQYVSASAFNPPPPVTVPIPLIYAYVWSSSPGVSSCDPANKPNGGQNPDQAMNVSSHEMAEAITDPFVGNMPGWNRNGNGSEIGDLCNFIFGANITASGADIALGTLNAEIQEEWSQKENSNAGACVMATT